VTQIADPKLVVKDLLESEWDTANTPEDSPPEFRTGWRDGNLSAPQITASHDEESPTSPTGFTGIGPDGPTSERRGTVRLNVWTRRDLVAANPKTVGYEFSEEIKRIVSAFGPSIHAYDGFSIGSLDAAGYRYLSWLDREFMPENDDADDVPIRYRYRLVIGYEYLDQ